MSPQLEVIDQAACCGDADVAPSSQDVAALFKALSDDTRLRIVRTLARSPEELCECHIVPLFGLSQSTISYHLRVLREAGLVEADKRGLWSYYRANPRALMAAIRALADLNR